MQWLPPFGKDDAKVVYESPNRITGVQYSEDCQWMFVTQTVDSQRQITAIDLEDPKKTYVDLQGRGRVEPKKDGRRAQEGRTTTAMTTIDDEQPPAGSGRAGRRSALGLMTRSVGGGVNVVRISRSGEVYVSGTDRGRGAAEGSFAKPYIDTINIKTGKKTRVFEGKGEMLETDRRGRRRRHQARVHHAAEDGRRARLVHDRPRDRQGHEADEQRGPDAVVPRPEDRAVPRDARGRVQVLGEGDDRRRRRRASCRRCSGSTRASTPTRPPTTRRRPRRAGGGAARRGPGGSPRPAPRSMAILTLAGYAVVEPDVPIVGPAGRMNDNYVPDLRNSLWAAIDELDKRGIIDRDRLACGGHSYGAFSTANALAHTPFFKAGIAGDGYYNRTLTSMSFQTERRQLWDARETYLEMSPLLWANRVNGALLMYHGMEDANVGTQPDQRRGPVRGARRAGQARGAVHVPVRGPRPDREGDDPRPVGPLGRVARHVREEPEEEVRFRAPDGGHIAGRLVVAF